MANDQGPIVQSALLRAELVKLRREKKLTQESVADSLEWSSSKLIRIEGGKNNISRTDLQALLLHYGVTSQTRQDELQDLAKGARGLAWWDSYRRDLGDAYMGYVGLEAGASVIRHFQGSVIPGLLQIPPYAQVIAELAVEPLVVGSVVNLRMQRQRELAKRKNPPTEIFVIDEAAVRRHVGIKVEPAIMPNQLEHVVKTVRENENVTVRVIPFSVGAHPGWRGPFTLLEFEGGLSDALYLEGARDVSVLTSGDDDRVTDYRDAFTTLLDDALSTDDSLALMERVAEEMS